MCGPRNRRSDGKIDRSRHLKLINRRVHTLVDFGIAVTQIDAVAPRGGAQTLQRYFEEAAKTL